MHAALGDEPRMQRRSGVLILFIFQQALHQHVARLGGRQLGDVVLNLDALARQQALRLDLQQRAGNQQEIAGDVQVKILHAAHFGQVLVGDLRDIDGADVNLLAADQVQQQIERPLEAVGANAIRQDARRPYEMVKGNSRLPRLPAVTSR